MAEAQATMRLLVAPWVAGRIGRGWDFPGCLLASYTRMTKLAKTISGESG